MFYFQLALDRVLDQKVQGTTPKRRIAHMLNNFRDTLQHIGTLHL